MLPRNKKSSAFLSLYLSVTLSNDEFWERHFAINAQEYRNLLISSDRFVVVHLRSTVSLQRWAEPPQNDEVE